MRRTAKRCLLLALRDICCDCTKPFGIGTEADIDQAYGYASSRELSQPPQHGHSAAAGVGCPSVGWSWASVSDPTNQFGFGLGGSDLGTQQTAGLVGGVQGGCDYQVGSFVFGVQGMFDGTSMKGNTIWQANPTFSNNGKIPRFGTVTGRVGVTFVPAAMFYAKAGVAFLHHDYSRDRWSAPLATGSADGIGWTAGVGVEWIIFGNWSLWAEYNYIGIGSRDVTFTLTGSGAIAFPAAAASFPLSIQENISAFQVGFNYRFMAPQY